MTLPASRISTVPYYSRWTVGDLADIVKRQFGDTAGVQIQDSDIINWTNQGIAEIATQNKIWETQATSVITAGSISVPLPSDLVMLEAVSCAPYVSDQVSIDPIPTTVVNVNGLMLTGVNFEQAIRQAGGNLTTQGDPQIWFIWSGTLSVFPVPNTDRQLTIYYRGVPPAVTSVGNTLPIPDKYFDTLVIYVTSKSYELDEDWQPQQIQRAQFTNNLISLKEETDSTSGDFVVVSDSYYEGTAW